MTMWPVSSGWEPGCLAALAMREARSAPEFRQAGLVGPAVRAALVQASQVGLLGLIGADLIGIHRAKTRAKAAALGKTWCTLLRPRSALARLGLLLVLKWL
jgi:hypothetical protein